MYRIQIIEDTPEEAQRLRSHLDRYAHERGLDLDVEVLPSALEFVNSKHTADLIFMDIDLPGINGMEAAQILRTYDPETPLVFVTNLAQYAVRGYQVDAIDFVVKPVEYYDFALRMDRAMRVVKRRSAETVALPTADGIRVVRLSDVVYIDIVKHDLHYHLASEEEPLRRRGSIGQVAQELEPKGFLKISASCVINMAQVARIRPTSVVMSDQTELFYSRSQKKAALERLASYVGRSI
ncbi:MAG: LytR/AlgR family response regulator transcription factor [Atopobiaceae bacterium]